MRWLPVFVWISTACCATPAPRLSLAEMALGSEYIVEGSVLRSWTGWDPMHQLVWTHYELSVTEWLKAPTPAEPTITVSEPGGTSGGITTRSNEAIPYSLGEQVIVLAWRTPEGFLRAAGNGQGKFTVTGFAGSRDRRLHWSPHTVDMLRGAREPDELLDGMRLDEFEIYVRQLIRSAGGRQTAH